MSSKENLGHRIGSPVDGYTTDKRFCSRDYQQIKLTRGNYSPVGLLLGSFFSFPKHFRNNMDIC